MAQANPVFPRAEGDNLVYVAAPSVGHEIGIMVAGIISMLLASLLFWVWWTFKLKADIQKEQARIEDLRRRGLWNECMIQRQNEGTGKEKAIEQ